MVKEAYNAWRSNERTREEYEHVVTDVFQNTLWQFRPDLDDPRDGFAYYVEHQGFEVRRGDQVLTVVVGLWTAAGTGCKNYWSGYLTVHRWPADSSIRHMACLPDDRLLELRIWPDQFAMRPIADTIDPELLQFVQAVLERLGPWNMDQAA